MEAHLANREKFFATKRGLPTVVWEAFMEKMENLREKIATAQSDIKERTDDISKISAFIAGFIMHTEDGGVQE